MKKMAPATALLSGMIAGLLSQNALAVTYDVYNDINPNDYSGTGEELAGALIGSGISYVDGSAQFQGNFDNSSTGGNVPDDCEECEGEFSGSTTDYGSASLFSGLNMGTIDGTDFTLPDGVLLTSGYAAPADSNTDSGFTGYASGAGDQGLDDLLIDQGFNDVTADATVLSFDFTVDAGVNAVSLDFIFGTEEYSEYIDDYPEIAAVFIDGVNYAGFSDGSLLTLTSATVGSGNFFNNDIWDNTDDPSYPVTPLDIEYDGVSAPLTLNGLLDANRDVHSIKIAISDTNDEVLDSGIFVANLQGLTLGNADGTETGTGADDPILPGSTDDGSFDFIIDVGDTGFGIDPSQPLFIDPYVATGYEYEAAGANFATVLIPGSYGDGKYNLYTWNGSSYDFVQEILAGDQFNLLDLDAAGVSKFMIDGIELSAGLDPLDATAFVTGVTFVNGGSISVTQTAIQTCDGSPDCAGTASVPEPNILFLLGAGLLGWRVTARRKV